MTTTHSGNALLAQVMAKRGDSGPPMQPVASIGIHGVISTHDDSGFARTRKLGNDRVDSGVGAMTGAIKSHKKPRTVLGVRFDMWYQQPD